MKRILITLVTLLSLAAVPASAQTYLSTTTLSAAVTSTTQTTITVASASGIAAGGQLYVDHELMNVVSVSGTTITVFRPQRPTTHNSAAVVIIIPAAAKATVAVTTDPAGSCTASSYAYLPLINTDTGNVWLCWAQGSSGPNTGRLWHATNTRSVNGVYSLLVNLQ